MPPTLHTLHGGSDEMANADLIFSGEARLIIGRAAYKKERPINPRTFDKILKRENIKPVSIVPPDRRLFSRKDIEAVAKRAKKPKAGSSLIK